MDAQSRINHGPSEPGEPRFLSVEDAAAVVGIRRSMAFGLIRRGKFPSVKVGGRRLVPVKALDDYIAALEDEARQPIA